LPTYEFRCNECKQNFEKFQRTTANIEVICPNCQSKNVQRLISAGLGLIFKGSGFYVNDYAKASTLPDKRKTSTNNVDNSANKPISKEPIDVK
jgi:putative FmdB family regulatory protein